MRTADQEGLFSVGLSTSEKPFEPLEQLGSRNSVAVQDRKIGVGGIQKVVSADRFEESNEEDPVPDAACRGWVDPPGQERIEALFVLSGLGLGIQRTDVLTSPVWLNLSEVQAIDAIGDPENGLTHVELVMHDSTVVGAGWSDAFCAAVVTSLLGVAEQNNSAMSAPIPPTESPSEPTSVPSTTFAEDAASWPEPVLLVAPPVVRDRSRLAHEALQTETSPAVPAAELGSAIGGDAPVEAAQVSTPVPSMFDNSSESGTHGHDTGPIGDMPEDRSAGLELEDVVYLGGYPGQTKKRKNCTAVLSRTGLEVVGPSDLRFRMSWESVSSIEPQNSDEARFRMNTKIHRDSSALVIECDQGITILLEARDCSTVPLRSAITQLLADLSVLVV
ncbi:MAG: hypothetical protein WCJ04_04750 [Actinomycetes bacterium]